VTAPSPGRIDRTVLLQDLLLAAVVAVLALVGFGVSLGDEFHFGLLGLSTPAPVPGPRALLEVAAETLPLTFRRAAPLLVFVLTGTASLATDELNQRPEPLPVGVLVALYTLATLRRPVVAVLGAAGYLAGLAVTGLAGLAGVTDDQFYTDLVVVVGTMTLGYGISLGRTRARLAEQQAAEVARAAEGRTRRAVEQEQARIAREMHDILGHHLSVIVAQAAAARRQAAIRPQAATDALGAVESVGREALSGLRRLVGLLRIDRGEPGRALPPGLDRLEPLVEQLRRAGLPVEVSIRGRHRPLPAAVETNAFRIIQEGLTNSLKYSSRTGATVTLTYGDDSLEIDIHDEGAAARPDADAAAPAGADADPSGGYGLIGMRQRVTMLGGELITGPDGSRGFRVTARLPVAGGTE
jgi:signal transduction histidine kinase